MNLTKSNQIRLKAQKRVKLFLLAQATLQSTKLCSRNIRICKLGDVNASLVVMLTALGNDVAAVFSLVSKSNF